jgi:hypothetical protein
MRARLRLLIAACLLIVPGASLGCRSVEHVSAGGLATYSENGVAAAARSRDEGGGLLRTGAIMLGPGVGRNWWRWQGDGLWGF